MSEDRPARLLPHPILTALIVLLVAAIVWLQSGDATGDEGMNNVFSYLAGLLAAGLYLLWFVVFSRQRRALRLGTLTLVFVSVVGLKLAGSIEGWTGSMLPVVHWAWEPEAERTVAAETTSSEAAASFDLKTTTARDFPGFLGPARDATIRDVRLALWDGAAPELVWRRPIGAGWSGFAVVDGVAVTQTQTDGSQHVVALDAASGAELWRHSYGSGYDHPLAGEGPHATPTIAGGRVFAQGPNGVLVCLEGMDGSLVWQQDLRALYAIDDALEQSKIQYGRSGSPLLVDGAVVVPVGGEGPDDDRPGIVAFDAASGERVWEGPPRAISHASPTLATLAGVEQLLVVNEDTVSGHAPGDGALLWEHAWPGSTAADANTSQPVVVGDAAVLVSKGYGQGAMMLGLARGADGSWSTNERWAVRRALRTKLTSAVVRDAHAYALSDGMLECVALSDGSRVWKEGRHGHGQLLLVGEHLLVLTEEGELLLVAATPQGEGEVLGRFPVLDGKTWNTFALSGDLALVRNGQEAAAVRLPLVLDGDPEGSPEAR